MSGFSDYLHGLLVSQRHKLHTNVYVTKAIFRLLSSCCQQIVLRLLNCGPLAETDITNLIGTHPTAIHSLHEVKKMGLISTTGGMTSLDTLFEKSLWEIFVSDQREETNMEDEALLEPSLINAHADESWQTILLSLLELQTSTSKKHSIHPLVYKILLHSKILKIQFDGIIKITKYGWKFLYAPQAKQLWEIIKSYSHISEERGEDELSVLRFLLNVGFWSVGRGGSVDLLEDSHKQIVQDWRLLGLIFQSDDETYHPTYFVSQLLQKDSIQKSFNGSIILESNLRLYAYSPSKVKSILLEQFTESSHSLPNLYVGQITRKTVLSLFRNGISYDELITFLTDDFHPQMEKMSTSILDCIKNQINMWSTEHERLQAASDGVLYHNFNSKDDFLELQKEAKSRGVIIWENLELNMMFVMNEAHQELQSYFKNEILHR